MSKAIQSKLTASHKTKEANVSSPSVASKLTRSEPSHSADISLAMCKELCKEMSEAILRGINERFDAFEVKFQSLLTSQADLESRMVTQEQAVSDHETRIQLLEKKCSELTSANKQLQTKVYDLEARSRRNNIKIVGITEGEESGKPTEFVSKLISKLFSAEHFPKPVSIDRAHRSLQPKPALGANPRTIMARVHHYQQKELIIRLGRQQPLEYNGKRIFIFPDYTNEVLMQRRAFRDVLRVLRDTGVKHSLRYPAKLHIHHPNGAPTIFSDPKEATRFVEENYSRSEVVK